MHKIAFALTLTALFATPALAAVDRATAVSTLAGLFNSADVCNLSISRAKVDAYRDANTPAGDTMYNVDVCAATHALNDQQKTWTKDQTAAYCKTAAETVKTLGMNL
jgi:hypothetical protein